MKLHSGIGPNPRTVKMFIAEKGIDVPLVEVDLMGAGRRHQVRAGLAFLGTPLIGDPLYGGPESERVMLHAWTVAIEGRKVEAPIPPGFGGPGS